MKGVELIHDQHGRISQIQVDVSLNPSLAEDIYNMIMIREREAKAKAQQSSHAKGERAMTVTAFRKMMREAKQSGVISQSEFFNQHPEWNKRKEKLS